MTEKEFWTEIRRAAIIIKKAVEARYGIEHKEEQKRSSIAATK